VSDAETPETRQIRMGIERTRAEMSGTIDAIQEKLNPQHIAEQVRHTVHEQFEEAKATVSHTVREQFEEAKATVRNATIGKAEAFMRDAGDSVNDVRYSTMDTVRSNPIPAAMVAIGLGWLFMNRSSSRSPSRERYDQYTRHRSDQYRYDNQYRGEMTYNPNHPAYRGDAMAMYPRGIYPSAQQHQDEGMLAQGQRRVGQAVGQAQGAVGGAVNQAQSVVGGAVNQAQNVVGSAVNQAQNAVGSAADTVGGAVSQAQHAVGDAAQQAAQVAGQTVQRAQETAGQLAHRTAYAAGRVEDQFQRTMWENPLAVGAVALAAGVAAGFALPQTERENQLMGETRDNLVEQAQQVASETVDKVQRVAGEVAKDAQQTAADKAREVGLAGTGTGTGNTNTNTK